MNELDEMQQNNMISNLPLLFANGYPTSLDKITETQLEKFIPFMVQCSLGHINLQGNVECSEPEWWPEDLPFDVPFTKPKKFIGNWMEKMKEVVIICYQFHKSVFLLRFCSDLASYEQASLRFINNYNSTTSLFDRRNNKLLVTFRNENMSYDQPLKNRKCLMQQKMKNGNQSQEIQHTMVEPAPFDIYLCDYCDAELYSKDAILEHEKVCNNDDDVIVCDSPQSDQLLEENGITTNNEDDELRIRFLLNFNLQCLREKTVKAMDINLTLNSFQKEESTNSFSSTRKKRLPKRNRTIHSLARCPTIPLSSPAGLYLVKSTKTSVSDEYLTERLDRVERFCSTPLLAKNQNKPKYFDKKSYTNNPHCTFKKPQEYSSHMYVFPRKQFSQKRRTENFLFFNSILIKRCRPISVRLKKITDQEYKYKKSVGNSNLNIKLTRDAPQSSNWKISHSTSEIIVETIDLCSSEEEDTTEYLVNDKFRDNFNAGKCYQPSAIKMLSSNKLHLTNINKEIPLRIRQLNNTHLKSSMQQINNLEYHKACQNNVNVHTISNTENSIQISLPESSCLKFDESGTSITSKQENDISYLIASNALHSNYKFAISDKIAAATNDNCRRNIIGIEIPNPSFKGYSHSVRMDSLAINNSMLPSSSTTISSNEKSSQNDNKQLFTTDQTCTRQQPMASSKELTSETCVISIDLTS